MERPWRRLRNGELGCERGRTLAKGAQTGCRPRALTLVADTSISGVRVARELDRLIPERGRPGTIGRRIRRLRADTIIGFVGGPLAYCIDIRDIGVQRSNWGNARFATPKAARFLPTAKGGEIQVNLDQDAALEMTIKLPGVRAFDPSWMRFSNDRARCGKPLR